MTAPHHFIADLSQAGKHSQTIILKVKSVYEDKAMDKSISLSLSKASGFIISGANRLHTLLKIGG
jgi:hypothetical protein